MSSWLSQFGKLLRFVSFRVICQCRQLESGRDLLGHLVHTGRMCLTSYSVHFSGAQQATQCSSCGWLMLIALLLLFMSNVCEHYYIQECYQRAMGHQALLPITSTIKPGCDRCLHLRETLQQGSCITHWWSLHWLQSVQLIELRKITLLWKFFSATFQIWNSNIESMFPELIVPLDPNFSCKMQVLYICQFWCICMRMTDKQGCACQYYRQVHYVVNIELQDIAFPVCVCMCV